MIEIALFPIPGCVSFPGTVFPLHVFEPRYRTMVQYCIEHDMPMAVCHTQKVVHAAPRHQTPEQALQSNQATYKPYPVFSAGACELVKTLDDGRMIINVHLAERYHAVESRQTLPFSIYSCDVYADRELDADTLHEARLLQQKILHRLLAITASNEAAQRMLSSDEWQHKDVIAFSFELMGMVQVEADLKQTILEQRSPLDRLKIVLEILNS